MACDSGYARWRGCGEPFWDTEEQGSSLWRLQQVIVLGGVDTGSAVEGTTGI